MPVNKPLVSVLVLSALRKESTRRCLDSLEKNASNQSVEIIVVDMGLDQDIREWLADYALRHPRVRVIFNDENVGTSRGRNQAFALSRGEFIIMLDNDATVTENWLSTLLAAAEQRPDAGLFGSMIVCPNQYVYFCSEYVYESFHNGSREIGVKVLTPYQQDDEAVNRQTEVHWYPTGSLMIRRSVMESIGGFDERFVFVEEDKDLCLRARKQGAKIVYCPASQAVHDRVKDDQYDERVRYGHIDQIKADIELFERIWDCSVELIYSKDCLRLIGYSDAMITSMVQGQLTELFTVV